MRVKAAVTTPKYKWGSVTHQSVGVVKGNALGGSTKCSLFSAHGDCFLAHGERNA